MTFYYVLSLSTILLLKITMVSIRKYFLFIIIFPCSPEFGITLSFCWRREHLQVGSFLLYLFSFHNVISLWIILSYFFTSGPLMGRQSEFWASLSSLLKHVFRHFRRLPIWLRVRKHTQQWQPQFSGCGHHFGTCESLWSSSVKIFQAF